MRLTGYAGLPTLNRGNGVFELVQNFGNAAGQSYAIIAQDLDQDGDQDIIIGNVADLNRVFLNNGMGTLSLMSEFGKVDDKTYALGIGDLNGDSAPDIIAGNSEGANIAYYQTTRSD